MSRTWRTVWVRESLWGPTSSTTGGAPPSMSGPRCGSDRWPCAAAWRATRARRWSSAPARDCGSAPSVSMWASGLTAIRSRTHAASRWVRHSRSIEEGRMKARWIGSAATAALVAAAVLAACGEGRAIFDVDVYSFLKSGADTVHYTIPIVGTASDSNPPIKVGLLGGFGKSVVDTVTITGGANLLNTSGTGNVTFQLFIGADSAGTYSGTPVLTAGGSGGGPRTPAAGQTGPASPALAGRPASRGGSGAHHLSRQPQRTGPWRPRVPGRAAAPCGPGGPPSLRADHRQPAPGHRPAAHRHDQRHHHLLQSRLLSSPPCPFARAEGGGGDAQRSPDVVGGRRAVVYGIDLGSSKRRGAAEWRPAGECAPRLHGTGGRRHAPGREPAGLGDPGRGLAAVPRGGGLARGAHHLLLCGVGHQRHAAGPGQCLRSDAGADAA